MRIGEIYWVNLDPAIGDEIRKRRPVIVINGGHDKHLKLAIVAPIIAWSLHLMKNQFFVSLEPDSNNGLQKESAVDCFQIRAISHKRFMEKIGSITKDKTDLIKNQLPLYLTSNRNTVSKPAIGNQGIFSSPMSFS